MCIQNVKYITLDPIKKVRGVVNLPGSKSITNRVLLLAAQAYGTTKLFNLSSCDDVHHMLFALKKIGVSYQISSDYQTCTIEGIGGPLTSDKKNLTELFLGNSGTAMRSLTAALSITKQNIILTGNIRMHDRPIGDLVDALRQGGCKIEYLQKNNYPPLRLCGGYCGGNIVIKGNISSQFLSGILMASPLAKKDSCLLIDGILVSKPYVDITISLMRMFGVKIYNDNYRAFYIKGNDGYHTPGEYIIEGDASSASYFLAAAAISGGPVRVMGVGRSSLQGDIYFADVLKKMGAIIKWGSNYIECISKSLEPIDMDVNHIPDAAMTAAIVALFVKQGMTTLRNIYNWRLKECDRLTAIATELRKVGAIIYEGKDYLSLIPPYKFKHERINTYDDHRIVMCCSLLALANIPITILNPSCVNKTFPDFFKKLFAISIIK